MVTQNTLYTCGEKRSSLSKKKSDFECCWSKQMLETDQNNRFHTMCPYFSELSSDISTMAMASDILNILFTNIFHGKYIIYIAVCPGSSDPPTKQNI